MGPVYLVRVAGFWVRFAAFLVDSLLVTAIWILMILLCSLLQGESPMAGFLFFARDLPNMGLALVLFLFFLLAYQTLFARFSGQTAGKRLLAIRVVTQTGQSLTSLQALRRAGGILLSFLPGLAGFLWAAFDRNRCGWHDYIGRTYVVHTESEL